MQNKDLVLDAQISSDEVTNAEVKVVSYIQREAFKTEIEFINCKGKTTKVPPAVNQLNLFIDEQGIVGCKSCLCNLSLSDGSITPIFFLLITIFLCL